jgi:type I restriction enzyme, S subunit
MNSAAEKKYRQTEVGLIPIDWKLLSYSQAFSFLNTASFSRDKLESFSKTGYIHYGDIHTQWNHFIDIAKEPVPKISSSLAKGYTVIKKGDLIMADASEDTEGVGKSVEVLNEGDNETIAGLHTFLLRDKSGEFIDGFKGYIHSINIVKKQFDKLATGMKVFGISKSNLKEIKIPVPTKSEQLAIAKVLSETDSLITNIEKLIAKKEAVKKGTMQALLTGKKRLPGFSEKWKEDFFSKIVWFQEGPGLRNWQFQTSGMKVINVTNLENGYLNLNSTERYISFEEFSKMYKHFAIDPNDIVMASSGNSYGKVAVVKSQNLPLLMNTSVIRFKPLSGLNYEFLLHYLKSNLFKNQIDLLITGGAQPNFGPYHLKKIILQMPSSEDEQTAIAKILTDMDIEIDELNYKAKKYRLIKQALMQNLLTGKIRLV